MISIYSGGILRDTELPLPRVDQGLRLPAGAHATKIRGAEQLPNYHPCHNLMLCLSFVGCCLPANSLFVFMRLRARQLHAAAAELNVTQPAVSRMLGRFEQYLGVRLFDRSAGGAILTEEGELLYRVSSTDFAASKAA